MEACDKYQCFCGHEEFQKILRVEDVGVNLYRYVNNENSKPIKSAGDLDWNYEIFILENTNDIEVTTDDLLPALFEKYHVSCPRCKYIIKRALKLCPAITSIESNSVRGVCEFCEICCTRSRRCLCVCEKIVNQFFVSKIRTDQYKKAKEKIGKRKLLLKQKKYENQLRASSSYTNIVKISQDQIMGKTQSVLQTDDIFDPTKYRQSDISGPPGSHPAIMMTMSDGQIMRKSDHRSSLIQKHRSLESLFDFLSLASDDINKLYFLHKKEQSRRDGPFYTVSSSELLRRYLEEASKRKKKGDGLMDGFHDGIEGVLLNKDGEFIGVDANTNGIMATGWEQMLGVETIEEDIDGLEKCYVKRIQPKNVNKSVENLESFLQEEHGDNKYKQQRKLKGPGEIDSEDENSKDGKTGKKKKNFISSTENKAGEKNNINVIKTGEMEDSEDKMNEIVDPGELTENEKKKKINIKKFMFKTREKKADKMINRNEKSRKIKKKGVKDADEKTEKPATSSNSLVMAGRKTKSILIKAVRFDSVKRKSIKLTQKKSFSTKIRFRSGWRGRRIGPGTAYVRRMEKQMSNKSNMLLRRSSNVIKSEMMMTRSSMSYRRRSVKRSVSVGSTRKKIKSSSYIEPEEIKSDSETYKKGRKMSVYRFGIEGLGRINQADASKVDIKSNCQNIKTDTIISAGNKRKISNTKINEIMNTGRMNDVWAYFIQETRSTINQTGKEADIKKDAYFNPSREISNVKKTLLSKADKQPHDQIKGKKNTEDRKIIEKNISKTKETKNNVNEPKSTKDKNREVVIMKVENVPVFPTQMGKKETVTGETKVKRNNENINTTTIKKADQTDTKNESKVTETQVKGKKWTNKKRQVGSNKNNDEEKDFHAKCLSSGVNVKVMKGQNNKKSGLITQLMCLKKKLKNLNNNSINSKLRTSLELEIESLEKLVFPKRNEDHVDDVVYVENVFKKYEIPSEIKDTGSEHFSNIKKLAFEEKTEKKTQPISTHTMTTSMTSTKAAPSRVLSERTGVIQYALSDTSFIEKGWTCLPTEKILRKINIFRMRPAHPEFNWFAKNKNKILYYDTGEKLAEYRDNGHGQWFYKNGRLALDYYDNEDMCAQQRYVIYSNGNPDERGRSRPVTVLGMFDYLGNGVVFDHFGKIRLKYNQTEGVVLDRGIGPVSHWKWHTLNEPAVLQRVMVDTYLPKKDPKIVKLGQSDWKKKGKKDGGTDVIADANEEMLAIEFDNFIKDKAKKTCQSYKPFQIKEKALKLNENFSLRLLDQATVYLLFRDEATTLRINMGMILSNEEIIDTEITEVGKVCTSIDKPTLDENMTALQRSIEYAQRFERSRIERERRIQPPSPLKITDKTKPLSKPVLRPAVKTSVVSSECRCRKPTAANLYYNSRFDV